MPRVLLDVWLYGRFGLLVVTVLVLSGTLATALRLWCDYGGITDNYSR